MKPVDQLQLTPDPKDAPGSKTTPDDLPPVEVEDLLPGDEEDEIENEDDDLDDSDASEDENPEEDETNDKENQDLTR